MRKIALLVLVLVLFKAGRCDKKGHSAVHKKHAAHPKHQVKKQLVLGMMPQPAGFAPAVMPQPDTLAPLIPSAPGYVPLQGDAVSPLINPGAVINPEQPIGAVSEGGLAYNPGGNGVLPGPSQENLASVLRPGEPQTSDGMARDGAIYLTEQDGVSAANNFHPSMGAYRLKHYPGRVGMRPNARVLEGGPSAVLGTGMSTDALKAITDTSDLDGPLKAFNSPVTVHATNVPPHLATEKVSTLSQAEIASQEAKMMQEENQKAIDAIKEAEYKNTVKNAEMAANLAQTAKTLETLIKKLHAQKKGTLTPPARHRGVPESPSELNGGWSEWANWSECSKSCGAGIKFARRACSKPRPQDGGEPCRGRRVKVVLCNVDVQCPAPDKPRAEIMLRNL